MQDTETATCCSRSAGLSSFAKVCIDEMKLTVSPEFALLGHCHQLLGRAFARTERGWLPRERSHYAASFYPS